MNLKIKKYTETEKNARILTEISGYCIINLIFKRLFNENSKLTDEDIINFEFMEYDYNKNNSRIANNKYIEYADNYFKRLR